MYENWKEPGNVEALKLTRAKDCSRKYWRRPHFCSELCIELRLLVAMQYHCIYCCFYSKITIISGQLDGLAMVMHRNHEGPAIFEMLNEALKVAMPFVLVSFLSILRSSWGKGELEEGMKKFQDLINDNPRDFPALSLPEEGSTGQFEIYESLVPEEFPQRGFLDDVVLEAKTKSRKWLQRDFKAEFSYKNLARNDLVFRAASGMPEENFREEMEADTKTEMKALFEMHLGRFKSGLQPLFKERIVWGINGSWEFREQFFEEQCRNTQEYCHALVGRNEFAPMCVIVVVGGPSPEVNTVDPNSVHPKSEWTAGGIALLIGKHTERIFRKHLESEF
ncbi:hypothetical protein F3Y22_tig00004630pilonHSYRG00097 [Hibiscus syriacus]|uniref:Uncharacterized protein n=1 Tax=Hibiscus syriacus TaxID=106335 RepID=A0A6A3CM33_HIBSY|nr:hypothetical protein F3Y22_tig00004630pilonHSYRG00097 [Hibiscus syriacus]